VLNYNVTSNHSYVDLNMVRAGEVTHPADWRWCGYTEIMRGRQRYRLLDRERLAEALAVERLDELPQVYEERIDYLLSHGKAQREAQWTEAVAVGDETFVERVRKMLGQVRRTWELVTSERQDGSVALKEPPAAYRADFGVQNGLLSIKIGPF
jgi:putative transposase